MPGFEDFFSWFGDTASNVGQGVADAVTGVGDYLGSITSNFGADPGSLQFPGIPAGQESIAYAGNTLPSIAGVGDAQTGPDFSGIVNGTGSGGLPPVSPSAPILSSGVPDITGTNPINPNALPGGMGGSWDNPGGGSSSGIEGLLKKNSWLLPAAGIGAAALKSQAPLQGTSTLRANADRLTAAAGPLMDPLTKGAALPPGAQAGIDASAAAMTASVRSRHASSGTSGSSMEAQELAQIPLMMQQQRLSEAQSLYSTGLQTMGMADAATQQIMHNTLSQDAALTNALARMAASMAPMALKDLTSG